MKKNIAKLLFLTSILSIGNILSAQNQNVSKDVKKPKEITIDENGKVTKEQQPDRNENNSVKTNSANITRQRMVLLWL